jgi:hypothetical protein
MRRKPPPLKYKRDYEKAVGLYLQALDQFKETGRNKDRINWQKAMLEVLNSYNLATGVFEFSRDVTFNWHIQLDLREAFRSVIDGKDADLFTVTPSDRYDSMMCLAKELAVGYVAAGQTNEHQQENKRWIMKEYGISRSSLNEWIRTTNPHDYDREVDGSLLSNMIDLYRKNKLTGRRRKP